MLLTGCAFSRLVLRLNKVVVKSTCSKRLECINTKKHWNGNLYLVSALNFYVNLAIDRDRVTKTAVVDYVEDPQFFQIRILC